MKKVYHNEVEISVFAALRNAKLLGFVNGLGSTKP